MHDLNNEMMKNILVIGSSNTDLVIQADHFPEAGETVMGKTFNTFAGGKGANQAVASARLGGAVTFIAKVGNDAFGTKAIEGFKKEGIHTDYIYRDDDAPSGVASIIIDKSGQNRIVVAPGANNLLSKKDIEESSKAIEKGNIVLTEVYNPIYLETDTESLTVCMRDGGFEVGLKSSGCELKWYTCGQGRIASMEE